MASPALGRERLRSASGAGSAPTAERQRVSMGLKGVLHAGLRLIWLAGNRMRLGARMGAGAGAGASLPRSDATGIGRGGLIVYFLDRLLWGRIFPQARCPQLGRSFLDQMSRYSIRAVPRRRHPEPAKVPAAGLQRRMALRPQLGRMETPALDRRPGDAPQARQGRSCPGPAASTAAKLASDLASSTAEIASRTSSIVARTAQPASSGQSAQG